MRKGCIWNCRRRRFLENVRFEVLTSVIILKDRSGGAVKLKILTPYIIFSYKFHSIFLPFLLLSSCLSLSLSLSFFLSLSLTFNFNFASAFLTFTSVSYFSASFSNLYFLVLFSFFLCLHFMYFPTRSLEHSTILYESPDLTPLLRIAWNKQDPNYLATILTDSPKAVILDIR